MINPPLDLTGTVLPGLTTAAGVTTGGNTSLANGDILAEHRNSIYSHTGTWFLFLKIHHGMGFFVR